MAEPKNWDEVNGTRHLTQRLRDPSIFGTETALRAADEIERLRKALEDIADGMGETDLLQIGRFAPAVARAALNSEEAGDA